MGHGKPARDAHHDGEDRHGHEQPHEEPPQGNRTLGASALALIRPFGIGQRRDHGQNGKKGREHHAHRIRQPHGHEVDHGGEHEGRRRVHSGLARRRLRVDDAEPQHDDRRARPGQRGAHDKVEVRIGAQARRCVGAHRGRAHHHRHRNEEQVAAHEPPRERAHEREQDEGDAQGKRRDQIGEGNGVRGQVGGGGGEHEHVAVVRHPDPRVVKAEAHQLKGGPLLLYGHAEAGRRQLAVGRERLLIITEPLEHALPP